MSGMWTEVIPGVLAALALFVVPGLAVLLCTRVAVPTALVAAPPVSLAVIAASTMVARVTGAHWGPLWVLGTALAVTAVCALWSWATPWGRRMPRWSLLSGPAAVQYLIGQVIALIFMVPLFLKAFVEPTTIAQRFDNALHLNAIEAVRRTGEATPFDTAELLRGFLYPNGWHTAGALVQDLGGLDLPQSVHALALVTMLGVWPMGMWLLIEVLVKPSVAVRLIAGPLMFAFPGFPLVLLDWGLVYPTILGLALAPALAAVLLHTVLRRTLLDSPVQILLIIALTGIGVGIAHPGSALAGLIIVLPVAIAALIRHLDRTVLRPSRSGREVRRIPRGDLVWAGLLAALSLAIAAVWLLMTPSTATAPWSTFQSTPQALGEVAFGGAMGRPTLMIAVVLCGLGLLSAFLGRGRDRLVLLALAGPGIVYWASAAAPEEAWRDLLAGFFYRDNFRTAAALTLVSVPVAVKGVETLARGVGALVTVVARRRRGDSSPRPVISAVVALLVGALAATGLASHVSQDPKVQAQYEHASEAYRTWAISDLVSGDEFRMFEELPEFVPEDAYVIADPWEGGGLTYAFSDREVNRMYMTVRRTPEERYLDSHLKDIGTDPQVCEALPTDQPLYYLDLEEHRLGKDDPEVSGYLGYQDISEDTDGFDLVHEVGEVRLYEVDAC
ncbi:DUF6541 family protein [Brachybacterium sp. FME24]|uniref:DUF6541 family protein n=1 Tax=Brachybacterium sp. FME24 TaxID=2742605 RepID=UPI0018664B95|nr:DUF6541 family protein [Brachybacterium sp. FME24]